MPETEMTVEDHQRALAQEQHHRPRLECEQIIQRASSINKDLINRMQNSQIGRTYICGYDFHTKQLCFVAVLLILFVLSIISVSLIWFTSSFDNFVLSHLIITPKNDIFEEWSNPTYRSHVKVHIFNYTNIDAFKAGKDKKLRVKDIGPYHYEEIKEKINVQVHDNGTVTYQDRLNHRFNPRLSKGKQSDVIYVPNILTLSAAKKTENNFFMQWTASVTLQSPFIKQAAHRFIWGYEDNAYNLMKGVLRFQNQRVSDNIGLLATRNGTLPYTLTVGTGSKSINNIANAIKIDSNTQFGKWSTEECDRIHGSDGTQFNPFLIREKKPITVLTPESCRTLEYVFSHEVKVINKTIKAYKYILPTSVYDAPDKNPDNQCYCDLDSGYCAPQGFLDISKCVFDTPLYISMPHFYNVDPDYFKVDGLDPTYSKAESYLMVHPRMGFAIGGSYKFQINILAKNLFGFTSMSMFKDDTMLPIAWVDVGLEENAIPEKTIEKMYQGTFVVKNIELGIKYVSILVMILSAAAIVIVTRSKWEGKIKNCYTNSA
nr:scavenger receptor class B member 1-like [Onthophagus taurus]